MQVARRFSIILLTMLAGLLAACSNTLTVESDVQAYSTWSASSSIKAPTYTFERLPSEQKGHAEQWQTRMEHLAGQALAEKGFLPVDQAPSYQAHVSANSERYVRDPLYWRGAGWGPFYGGWYRGYYGGPWGMWEPYFYGAPYYTVMYKRTVGLTLRDIGTGHVVYETRAVNDDIYVDSDAVFLAMFRAALQGFPHPSQKVFRVREEVPRQ